MKFVVRMMLMFLKMGWECLGRKTSRVSRFTISLGSPFRENRMIKRKARRHRIYDMERKGAMGVEGFL